MRLAIKITIGFVILLLIFLLFQYFWSGYPEMLSRIPEKKIVAHRGVHLNYKKGSYDPIKGCEARHIYPPYHAFIGNTIPSIEAAFNYGAAIVEIDIRQTADRQLVVFHDLTLDCRTEASGPVSDYTLQELKQLDIGYGYTADSGKTYPFRGKGIGLIPTLKEVLNAFPEKSFIIDHKDWNQASIELLMRELSQYPQSQRARIYLWTQPKYLKTVQEKYPEINALFLTRKQVKKHFLPFFLSFGLLDIPSELHGRIMVIPAEYIPYVWGWPYRFINAVRNAGLKLYILTDTREKAEKYKALPVDGFLTDYIEVTGPVLKNK